ncbi:hypothetical protein [Streptomyces poonensis]|uniref:hypothetical protein n=1 Tax=Streptomyces poonensis TaxID=68255 RepID=UPI001677F332|nr:hypothetical protein [Streptomyces poonensis]
MPISRVSSAGITSRPRGKPGPAADLIADALTRADPHDPRPARDPGALAEIAAHCGRLPLALVIAAMVSVGVVGFWAAYRLYRAEKNRTAQAAT